MSLQCLDTPPLSTSIKQDRETSVSGFEYLGVGNLLEVEHLYRGVQQMLGAERFFLLDRTPGDFHRALFWPNDLIGIRSPLGNLRAFIGMTPRPCALPDAAILSEKGKQMVRLGHRADLTMLAVDPAARGQNLSTRLIEEGCESARRAGCKTAFTRVALGNRFGLSAFFKAGFEGVGITPRPSDRKVELMILARDLSGKNTASRKETQNDRILPPTISALAPALRENFHIVSIVPPSDPATAPARMTGEIRHHLRCLPA